MKCKCRKIEKTRGNKITKITSKSEECLVIRVPKLVDVEQAVNKTVIGQEKVVKSVCTKIYESLCFPDLKSNILLVGRSGTGKTEIVRQLSEHLNLPCTIEDATRYTEDGYVGASVTDMINNLIDAANGNLDIASRGIIFIDEIDKKASRGNYIANGEFKKEGVLKGLLKIIEGTEVSIPISNSPFMEFGKTMKFDTSNLIFILGGAFEGLDKIKEKRLKKDTKIGFASAEVNHIVINNYMNTTFTKEDLIEYGLPAELVGRISSIYETKELDVHDLRNILDYSKKSEFRKYEKVFKGSKIELIYSSNLFNIIAQNANRTLTGARELNSLVSHIFEKIMYDIFSNAEVKKYTKCVLDDDIVSDNSKYHWE